MDTVTFGTKNSYTDFGLILSSKSVSLPRAKTKTVEVPGADGELDLTDVLTDEVKYSNRKLQFTFTVIDHFNGWATRLSQVTNYLHGRRLKVMMDWDKHYYYEGRCTVNSLKSKKRTATIVIDVDASPWKMERNAIYQPWEWDDFCFIDGIIRKNTFHVIGGAVGGQDVTLINTRKPATPTVTCSVALVFTLNGATVNVPPGTTTLNTVKMVEGENIAHINASADDNIEITWKGGSL